jgi:glucuronoarabinoxylan endo-1,4-beta-xylanase
MRQKILILSFCFLANIAATQNVTVTIDRTIQHQTIEGFGFFGAQEEWWEDGPHFTEAWAELILQDLGITIWRNEYYPPEDTTIQVPYHFQDSNWEEQRPVVAGLQQKATELNVPLKFMVSVWSPPADMKCAIIDDEISDEPHPFGAKEGGTLCPEKYDEFAQWLIDGIALYESEGIDLYALSPQNEPLFQESYNSCVYYFEWFSEMIKNAMPIVKNAYPNVKIVGAENLIELEVGNHPYSYSFKLSEDAEALNLLDAWAGHGYISNFSDVNNFLDLNKIDDQRASVWNDYQSLYANPNNKPVWMTEGGGQGDDWQYSFANDEVVLGAYDLGKAIWSSLVEGNTETWMWWQGSSAELNDFSLMRGTEELSKKYFVCKQFFRYIRPNAQRVEAITNDENVHVAAFENTDMEAFTIVLLNDSEVVKTVDLSGLNVPETYAAYLTSEIENTAELGQIDALEITLPPLSILTLVNGNVFENPVSTDFVFKTESKALRIAPNPVKNELSFFIENVGNEIIQLEIINVLGQIILVEERKVQQGWNELDLSKKEVVNGTYFLQVSTENKRSIGKIVLAK